MNCTTSFHVTHCLPYAELQPLTYNASLNDDSSIVFTCFFRDESFDPIWRVNGLSPLLGDTQEVRGIGISVAVDGLSSNLTIRRRLINNNITIQCMVVDLNSDPPVFSSCVGLLKVQGKLQ